MRLLRFSLVACLVLFVTACGSKPADLIVGKWEGGEGDKKGTMEFTKDGKVKVSMGPMSLEGTYKFVSDDTMEVTMMGQTAKVKVKVTKDELEMTTEGKTDTEKFKRAK